LSVANAKLVHTAWSTLFYQQSVDIRRAIPARNNTIKTYKKKSCGLSVRKNKINSAPIRDCAGSANLLLDQQEMAY